MTKSPFAPIPARARVTTYHSKIGMIAPSAWHIDPMITAVVSVGRRPRESAKSPCTVQDTFCYNILLCNNVYCTMSLTSIKSRAAPLKRPMLRGWILLPTGIFLASNVVHAMVK